LQPEPAKVELILLNYYLPGLSGVKALAKLRDYYAAAKLGYSGLSEFAQTTAGDVE